MPTNQLRLIKSDPTTRTEVHCDREEHITIVKPANPNDGYPNQVTSGPCDCTDEAPQTPEAFEALGVPAVIATPVACGEPKTFAGMIKRCTEDAGHEPPHKSGDKTWT